MSVESTYDFNLVDKTRRFALQLKASTLMYDPMLCPIMATLLSNEPTEEFSEHL